MTKELPTSYSTDEIHTEVETLLFGLKESKMLTYELIASDPRYYISIIQNYKIARDYS